MKALAPLLICVGLLAGDPGVAAQEHRDLESIRSIPDLEKRSRSALEFARDSVDSMVKAYQQGDSEQGEDLLDQIQQAVELSLESLKATGKIPHKKPKHFKRAEIETRKLLRDLDGARAELSYDQREYLDSVYERVSEINSELLMGIMTKPKKKKE
jgi:predicted RNase H-like HicB family nuclease